MSVLSAFMLSVCARAASQRPCLHQDNRGGQQTSRSHSRRWDTDEAPPRAAFQAHRSPSGHARRRGRRCRRRWTPHGPHVPSRRPSGCCSKKWRRGARREGPRLVAQLLLQRRHVAAVHVRVAHADDQLARAQAAHLPPAARTLSRAGAAARPAGRPAGALPSPCPAAWGAGGHGGAAEAVQCGQVGMGWGTGRCHFASARTLTSRESEAPGPGSPHRV